MDLANQLNLELPDIQGLIKNFENAVQLKSKVNRRVDETQSYRQNANINIYDSTTRMPRKTSKEGPTVIHSSNIFFFQKNQKFSPEFTEIFTTPKHIYRRAAYALFGITGKTPDPNNPTGLTVDQTPTKL